MSGLLTTYYLSLTVFIMSYLVLARKWRPQVFEAVIGQGHVTQTLQNAITSGRIAHAYIFSGPRGVGKTTVARILAKALNCAKGPTPIPCNECQSCKGIIGGSSVDVLEIDGASNTSVDNVRELRENIRYLPSDGRYRVYIIDEVHMLSMSAFNALLKTLEEPPPHAVFIFATTEVHKVPLTILSRCQRFDFRRIPLRDVQAHIRHIARLEGISVDDTGIYLITREAEGSLRDAQGLLDQVVSYAGPIVSEVHVVEALGLMDRSLLHQLTEAILKGRGGDCLNIIEKAYNFGYDIKRFCQDLLEYIRDLVIIKVVEEPKGLLDLPDSEVEGLEGLVGLASFQNLQRMFNILYKGYEELTRATFPRLLMEMTVLKMAHLETVQPISTILGRLDELEVSLRQQPLEEPLRRQLPRGSTGPEEGLPRTTEDKVQDETVVRGLQIQEDEKETLSQMEEDPWPRLLEFVRKRRPPLGSHLEFAHPISLEGGEVSIKVKKGHYFNYLADNKEGLEELFSEFFKRRVNVEIKVVKDEPTEDHQSFAPSGREDQTLEEAMRVLGGEVLEDRKGRADV